MWSLRSSNWASTLATAERPVERCHMRDRGFFAVVLTPRFRAGEMDWVGRIDLDRGSGYRDEMSP